MVGASTLALAEGVAQPLTMMSMLHPPTEVYWVAATVVGWS